MTKSLLNFLYALLMTLGFVLGLFLLFFFLHFCGSYIGMTALLLVPTLIIFQVLELRETK